MSNCPIWVWRVWDTKHKVTKGTDEFVPKTLSGPSARELLGHCTHCVSLCSPTMQVSKVLGLHDAQLSCLVPCVWRMLTRPSTHPTNLSFC